MRLTEEHKAKMKAGGAQAQAQAQGQTVRQSKPERPTRKMILAKCLDCLGGARYDCKIADCPLYPAYPWRGRPIPVSYRDAFDFDGNQTAEAVSEACERAAEAWDKGAIEGESLSEWMVRMGKRPQDFFGSR